METSFFFFSCLFFSVASRNNSRCFRACMQGIVVHPTLPYPAPTSGKARLRAGLVGEAYGEKSDRLVAGESVPRGRCLLTHHPVPGNRPLSAQ